MTNKQIKEDYKRFLETGCDYSQDMRDRDQDTIRKAELWSLVFFGLGAFCAGFTIATIAGVTL